MIQKVHYKVHFLYSNQFELTYFLLLLKYLIEAKGLKDSRDRLNARLKTEAKGNQVFGNSRGDNSLVPGWQNEREYMDLFYNASSRGPLGLY